VATVSIGNARNAGLLAVRMLAAHDEKLLQQMLSFQEGLAELAKAKGSTVRDGAAELRKS
jgi:5-(carboxyamino)imidazole ribonucleotide mutase